MIIHRVLNRLFGKAEEINGAKRCPTYLFRWVIGEIRQHKIYLHHFVGDDWSRDLHDHPKRFWSIGIWGSYIEETPSGIPGFRKWTVYSAPWIRSFPAEHRHRLFLANVGGEQRTCWTIVIVGPAEREWGFYPDGKFVPWNEYVHSDTADKRKSCP